MGMSYRYSGSASYPRFEEEVEQVVQILGGRKASSLQKKQDEVEGTIYQWFGCLQGDKKIKFYFPAGTPEAVIRFFNDIYGYHNADEVFDVWEYIYQNFEGPVADASPQIWRELRLCVEFGTGWDIDD